MRTPMRTLLSVVVSGLIFVTTGSAFAQTDTERAAARDAASSGRAAYDAGQYQKALDSLMHAEQIVHAPTHLLYIARSQAKLGKLVAAFETYRKLTREALASDAPQVFVDAQTSAQEEQQALEGRVPWVTVTVHGEGEKDAAVTMDDAKLPAAIIGIRLPIDPGQHVFKAKAPSAESPPVTVVLAEGGNASVELKLAASGVEAASAPPAAKGGEQSITTDTLNTKGSSSMRIASYAALGVGAVGLGLGTFFVIKGSSTSDSADELYDSCSASSPGGKCSDEATEDEILAKDNDASSQRTLGAVALVAGGAGVAAGVTLLILDMNSAHTAARLGGPSVRPWVGFRTVGLTGSF